MSPVTKSRRFVLPATRAMRSPEVASFLAQLDDQARRLREDTRGLTRAALAWQSRAGMNTMGMLLAHQAVVEVYWIQLGPLGIAEPASEQVLGIGLYGDGMPLKPGLRAPASLRGKGLAYFDDLLARAREHTRRASADLTDADLDREVEVRRKRIRFQSVNLRWIYYHVLEHYAGHYGQILLLRHLHRARR